MQDKENLTTGHTFMKSKPNIKYVLDLIERVEKCATSWKNFSFIPKFASFETVIEEKEDLLLF